MQMRTVPRANLLFSRQRRSPQQAQGYAAAAGAIASFAGGSSDLTGATDAAVTAYENNVQLGMDGAEQYQTSRINKSKHLPLVNLRRRGIPDWRVAPQQIALLSSVQLRPSSRSKSRR